MSNITRNFLILSGLFVSVHYLAVQTALYWTYPWFDIVMHFWGGILLVFGTFSLRMIGLFTRRPRKREIFIIAFIAIIAWEIFEQSAGVTSAPIYILDTIKDIVVGFIGVLVGYVMLRRK